MRRWSLLAVSMFVLVAPRLVGAQPDPMGAPSPPPDPSQPPPFDPNSAPPPQPAQPPPPMYQPVYQQQPQAPMNLKQGMTVELNLGIGYVAVTSDNGGSDDSEAGLAGLDLGIGGWVSPNLAITGRIAGVTLSDPGVRLSAIFVGPSAQYWVNQNLWVGGGIGIAALVFSGDNVNVDPETGVGLDLRVGYTFATTTENTFNVSFELTPGFYDGGRATGVGVRVGYQHL